MHNFLIFLHFVQIFEKNSSKLEKYFEYGKIFIKIIKKWKLLPKIVICIAFIWKFSKTSLPWRSHDQPSPVDLDFPAPLENFLQALLTNPSIYNRSFVIEKLSIRFRNN